VALRRGPDSGLRAACAARRRWRPSSAPSSSPLPTSTWVCFPVPDRQARMTRDGSGVAMASRSPRRTPSKEKFRCDNSNAPRKRFGAHLPTALAALISTDPARASKSRVRPEPKEQRANHGSRKSCGTLAGKGGASRASAVGVDVVGRAELRQQRAFFAVVLLHAPQDVVEDRNRLDDPGAFVEHYAFGLCAHCCIGDLCA
jgi:hypothetical protein